MQLFLIINSNLFSTLSHCLHDWVLNPKIHTLIFSGIKILKANPSHGLTGTVNLYFVTLIIECLIVHSYDSTVITLLLSDGLYPLLVIIIIVQCIIEITIKHVNQPYLPHNVFIIMHNLPTSFVKGEQAFKYLSF